MEIKASIILPCYNGGLYIEKTIFSIINQSFKNWECIIVNDGSTDNSLEIINKIFSHSLKTNQQIDC